MRRGEEPLAICKRRSKCSVAEPKAGDDTCMYGLGASLAQRNGGDQDWAQAFSWFQRGADAGNPACMNDLAACYDQGKGVTANQPLALRWFVKSAVAGYGPARMVIGAQALVQTASSAEGKAVANLMSAMGQMIAEAPKSEEEIGDELRRASAANERIRKQRDVDRRLTELGFP